MAFPCPITLLAFCVLPFAGSTPSGGFDPTSAYPARHIEGWRVLVSDKLLTDAERDRCARTLRLLEDHLFRIAQVIPEPGLAELRRIPIWVELAHPQHPCMCFHVSAGWLRDHDMNPEKAGAVEIANAANFLTWTRDQPWMVLHELAHGYLHRVLGVDHTELRACFAKAAQEKIYESVLRGQGTRERAYALENVDEYFAESSEAYFGVNDFYPFVRAELREHDPAMHELLGRLWGVTR